MSPSVEKVLRDAMNLDDRERAALAVELVASLDGTPDADAEEAWAKEVELRAERVLAGKTTGRDWPEVRDRIKKGIRNR